MGMTGRGTRTAIWVAPALLLSTRMDSARLVIRAILAAMVVVGCGMWIDDTQISPPRDAPFYRPTTTVSDWAGDELPPAGGRAFILDRYGNRIEEAVGDYRVDPRGDIFERHSPSTAVPRLPDPST
jgi:hypothetical protein